MLTATPIQNRIWDLYSLLDCLAVAKGHQNPLGTPEQFKQLYLSGSDGRKLHPSNAEDYFSYGDGYRNNVRGLPVDDQSVVIRTIATNPLHSEYGRTLPKADHRWHYQVQPIANLQAWLEREKSHRNFMLKAATRDGTMSHDTGHKGLSVVGMK